MIFHIFTCIELSCWALSFDLTLLLFIFHKVAELVASEFFEQGDMERSQFHSEPIVSSYNPTGNVKSNIYNHKYLDTTIHNP